MKEEIKVLFKTPWVSLRRLIVKDYDVNGYDYLHEDRCDGQIVAVLPFRYRKVKGESVTEYLLRKEVTPCWDYKKQVLSSITGGVETDSPEEDILRELEEEAGYGAFFEDLISLGKCFGTKSSDTVYHLFTINLTDYERGEAKGDGSELEAKAECVWTTDISKALDPFVFIMHYRLNKISDKRIV